MTKQINTVIIALFLILGLFSLCFCDESMTITAYYPSPYGSYNQLTTTGNTYLATSSGNVGIGTTGPQSSLEIQNPNNGPLFMLGGYAPWWATNTRFYFAVNNNFCYYANALHIGTVPYGSALPDCTHMPGEIMTLMTSGNVGIGTASPGSYKLNVNGTIYTSGGCTGCSDARWKANITPITFALDKIMSLQGKQFNWKIKEYPDMFFHEGIDYGLVAQDTEKVLPEIVYQDHGYKYIRYERLSAILIEAMKEQQGQIKALRQEINELKAKLNE